MARQSRARSARDRASRGRQLNERTRDERTQEAYNEMLAEAESRDPAQFHEDRPIKRRRMGDMRAISLDSSLPKDPDEMSHNGSTQQLQTVYDSGSSDESDIEWEDVDIPQPLPGPSSASLAVQENDEPLEITLGQEPQSRKKAIQKRKPITAAEKKIRLDVHKSHLLCLLGHVSLRNRWCNDNEIHKFLKRMLPKRILALLNPDECKPQFSKSTTFVDGLNQAADIFSRRFRITKPGLKRAHWAEGQEQLKQKVESIMSNAEVFLSREDFISQAKMMQGSRDFGAQLFCALLRSVAIESRLVCSLQALPFSGTVKDMTPSKKGPEYIVISSDDRETSTDERRQKASDSPSGSRVRRLGRPEFKPRPIQSSARLGPIPTPRESSYPVFWVEAFNEAMQKWVSVDPIVTKTLGKPFKFEPPASDPYNMMNYVVGFEDDASARDVTRRYAKAFNAKTRKLRVESTRHGEKWWDHVLKAYERPFFEDRDELEISELTSKSAAEPMPRNILDFKDHPVYALERHIRRNEVIFPKRVIGHVGLSKSGANSDTLDSIYRRSDVHTVRSADKWYRMGRDVKVGEQPLKRVNAIRPKGGVISDDETDEPEQTALYAEYQTHTYHPPPVVQGRIPKNSYGNLDVYVPSMIPPGGIHIKQPEAARAARLLGIDYADAVTGFDFKGRRGTAVFGGIVIATEYQEALAEVLRGFADDRQQTLFEARSAEALRLWRLFLIKLRIAERVKSYAAEDEELDAHSPNMGIDEDDAGGGFFPDSDQPTQSPPHDSFASESRMDMMSHAVDESSLQDDALGGGFVPDEALADGAADTSVRENEDPGGGFITNDLQDDELFAIPPTATRSLSSPEKAKQRGLSNAPRYELVVIPNNNESVAKENTLKANSGNPQGLEGSSEQAAIAVDSSTNRDSKSASVEFLSRPPSPPAPAPEPKPPSPVESDSEIEKGSLLSEDPEDEDAVPDWLMFD